MSPSDSHRSRRIAEIACGLALVLFVASRCLFPMDETDLFFNLRLGEIVLGTHTVPRTNLLSFTFPEARDVNLAWLFQVILALAYRAGGIAGTVVLKTTFVAATFALLYRVACRRGAHPAAAAGALALAAWAAEPRFVERPHLVTFLGLAYLLWAVERAETGRPRALYALPPLALLWANANSCFFLGPAVLALYAAGARLDGRRADARRAALVALALVPFIFATPSGAGVLPYLANHWRMPWLRPLQEYRTARWPLDAPFFFVAAGVAIAAALPGRRFRVLLPALALGTLGAARIRFVAEFALLAGPIVALGLTELGGRIRRPILDESQVTTMLVAGLVTMILLPRQIARRAGEPWLDLGIERGLVPFSAIRFVDENGLRDRLYNDLEVGSYLAWQGWPQHRVFQDPRINGYPASFHAVLRRDDLSRPEWDAWLARFGVTAALVSYPDLNPRAAWFDPERWALVYRDAEALVFAARRQEFAALIARAELPVTFEYARGAGVEARPLAAEPLTSPLPACEWQRRLGDFLVETGDDGAARAAYLGARATSDCLDLQARGAAGRALGDLGLRTGDPALAADAYAGLDDARARANRGLALMSLRRAAEAEVDLTAALAADPNQPEARLAQALAFKALGRRAEAISSLRTFLALAPGDPAAGRARAELVGLGSR